MTRVKSLFGDTVVYGASTIVGRLLNYLLVPVYTQVFAPGEYGIVTELYAYIAFLNVLFTFGMETTFFRYATKFKDKYGHYFDLALSLLLINICILGGLIYFNAEAIANFMEYPGQAHLIRWLALIISIDTLVAIPFAELRLKNKAIRFASYRLFSILLNLVLNIGFLVILPSWLEENPTSWTRSLYDPELGVGYVFLSNLLANAIYIVLFSLRLLRFRPTLKKSAIGPMMSYAYPLVIIGLAGITNEMFSRAMLKYLLPEGFYAGRTNLEVLGIFGACYKLSVLMTLAVQAFRYAFEPFFFRIADQSDAKDSYANVMSAFVLFGTMAWIGITFLLPEIAPIFLRQPIYLEGLPAVPVLLAAGLLLGVFVNLSVWYKLTDKTYLGAVISVIGAGLTLVLNIMLIPIMGYMGSAWASVFTYGAICLVSLLWGRKHYQVPYHYYSLIGYLLFSSVMVYLITQWSDEIVLRYFFGILGLITLTIIGWRIEKRHLSENLQND